jgi:hypothetical protein
MDIVFKAKHWQIFGTLILISFFQAMLRTADPIVSAISYIILIVVSIGWILLLGIGLTKKLPNQNSRQFAIFISTGIILIVVVTVLRLLMTFGIVDFEKNTTTLTVVLASYFILSLAVIYSYPAKTLKSLETKGEIDINDYFGDIFRLLFWPIGIWTIQPRINKMANERVE